MGFRDIASHRIDRIITRKPMVAEINESTWKNDMIRHWLAKENVCERNKKTKRVHFVAHSTVQGKDENDY